VAPRPPPRWSPLRGESSREDVVWPLGSVRHRLTTTGDSSRSCLNRCRAWNGFVDVAFLRSRMSSHGSPSEEAPPEGP
jgi:hypothetical protein